MSNTKNIYSSLHHSFFSYLCREKEKMTNRRITMFALHLLCYEWSSPFTIKINRRKYDIENI